MKTLDVTKDGTLKLVANDDFTEISYQPHDGSPLDLEWALQTHIKQAHTVACAKRDGADRNGLILGPFRKADPAQWRVLEDR